MKTMNSNKRKYKFNKNKTKIKKHMNEMYLIKILKKKKKLNKVENVLFLNKEVLTSFQLSSGYFDYNLMELTCVRLQYKRINIIKIKERIHISEIILAIIPVAFPHLVQLESSCISNISINLTLFSLSDSWQHPLNEK